DLAVRRHEGTVVYQIKSGERPFPNHRGVAKLATERLPDLVGLYVVTQGDPPPTAWRYLTAAASALDVPVAWYTADWVATHLLEAPDAAAYFIAGGRETVYNGLRRLRDAWEHRL